MVYRLTPKKIVAFLAGPANEHFHARKVGILVFAESNRLTGLELQHETGTGGREPDQERATESHRVLHIVPALFGPDGIIGGGERYALELARNMAACTPTRLVAFGDKNQTEKIGELIVRVIGDPWYVRGQRTNPVSFSLLSELRRADVVHCHQQHVLASSLAAAFCRLSGKRVFVSNLGGGGWDISTYFSTDRWYDGHLHISEYSRRLFGHTMNSAAHVISGGVDIEKFSPIDLAERERTVLFVGRLLPHKGINDLINALPQDLDLQIIGQPDDRRFLVDLQSLAKGKHVTFRHDCDDTALVNAYRRAMCVVLPSVYRTMYGDESRAPELLGQTLLEGMACGTPSICTNVASMPEIVEDGVTGFIVLPGDPLTLGQRIRWLADRPAQAQKMGHAARARVIEKFTWPQVVRRCLSIYAGSHPG
jgi:glycosyltransferase involved in cell wall biosynthesis